MDEQQPGIFDNGDQTDQEPNKRERGDLTDSTESRQLYSEVGERVQELAGNQNPTGGDIPKQENSAPRNENLVAERFSQDTPRNGANEMTSQRMERRPLPRDTGQPGQSSGIDDQPLVPDDAFEQTPLPLDRAPITGSAPAPDNETPPYRGESDTMPFGEGDEIRNWTTGLGEQQG